MSCVRKSATPWRWLVAVSALVTVTLSHPDTPLETLHTLCTLCNSVPVAPGFWSPIIRAADSETLSRHPPTDGVPVWQRDLRQWQWGQVPRCPGGGVWQLWHQCSFSLYLENLSRHIAKLVFKQAETWCMKLGHIFGMIVCHSNGQL